MQERKSFLGMKNLKEKVFAISCINWGPSTLSLFIFYLFSWIILLRMDCKIPCIYISYLKSIIYYTNSLYFLTELVLSNFKNWQKLLHLIRFTLNTSPTPKFLLAKSKIKFYVLKTKNVAFWSCFVLQLTSLVKIGINIICRIHRFVLFLFHYFLD